MPDPEKSERHTISVLVENRPGVLARVSGLFARRGFNIHSLTVSATETEHISRMTVVTGGGRELEQIVKQLNKLVEVIEVLDHTLDRLIEREIALVKLHADRSNRSELMQLASLFHARVASISPREETMILEIIGEGNHIDAFLETVTQFPVLELVRTGKIAMVRGRAKT